MSETHIPSKYLKRILEEQGDLPEDHDPLPSSSSEWQTSAQAFNLHVEHLDGRRTEGFAWAHYVGYEWTDDGDHETLALLFGARAIEIVGVELRGLVEDIRRGHPNTIRELPSSKRKQLEEMNPEKTAIIASIRTYPELGEILKELKGEKDEHETRHARRA